MYFNRMGTAVAWEPLYSSKNKFETELCRLSEMAKMGD